MSLKFTPLGIVGHLACQVPWTEIKNVRVTIPDQPLSVSADVHQTSAGSDARYSAEISSSALDASIRPSPRDLILTSYNMTLSCLPVAALLHPIVLSIAPLVPELRGDVRLSGQRYSFDFQIKPVVLEKGGVSLTLQFRNAGAALLFGTSQSPK